MSDFIKRAREWLWEKKGEIFLQVVLIPFLLWLMNYLASLFFDSEVIRAILFGVAMVVFVAGGCYLIVRLDRRKGSVSANRRLALLRIVHEGEKLLQGFHEQGGEETKNFSGPELPRWYDQTLSTLKASFGDVWAHFDDMEKYPVTGGSAQAEMLIKRLHDIIGEN